MDDRTRDLRTKLIIGGAGIILSIFGYFLIDRDVEIRRNIAAFTKAVQDVAVEMRGIAVRTDDIGKRAERIDETQKAHGERISRLEALMEDARKRNEHAN